VMFLLTETKRKWDSRLMKSKSKLSLIISNIYTAVNGTAT